MASAASINCDIKGPKEEITVLCGCGVVSANTTAISLSIEDREEGNSIQHNSVAGVGFNFGSLTLVVYFLVYVSTAQFGGKFLSNT